MKRRNFIRKTLSAAAGAILLPAYLYKEKTFAKTHRLNSSRGPVPAPETWLDSDITAAWIGHSTVLINFFGTWILTDPVLFDTIGVYFLGMTFGPNRYSAPALELEEMPKPDIVLLSHAHMDHMDYKTLLNLTDKFPGQIDCITAYNTKDVIHELQWKSLQEIDWNEECSLQEINFKALEVKHFGWRFPWEKDRSKGFFEEGRSYNAYLIEKNGRKILFGGDTAFSEKFLSIKNEEIDIAIMPIGAYNPWRHNHCNPEEALIMSAVQFKAKNFLPIHCNTFRQGVEPVDEPLKWLLASAPNYDINVGIAKIGETFTLKA